MRYTTAALAALVVGSILFTFREARPGNSKLGSLAVSTQKPVTPEASWALLQTLNFETGEVSQELNELNAKTVRVPGFMVPLEDDSDLVSDFLLVPYAGACVHVPPPPPNQIVRVRMAGAKVKVSLEYPVWVTGKLEIQNGTGPYGDFSFQISATGVQRYTEQ